MNLMQTIAESVNLKDYSFIELQVLLYKSFRLL